MRGPPEAAPEAERGGGAAAAHDQQVGVVGRLDEDTGHGDALLRFALDDQVGELLADHVRDGEEGLLVPAGDLVHAVEHGHDGADGLEHVPDVQQPQRRLAQLGFPGRVLGARQVVLVADGGEDAAAFLRPLDAAHHDDGGPGGRRRVEADGAEHERIEAAQAAVAHDDGAVQAGGPVQAGDGVGAAELGGDGQPRILGGHGLGRVVQEFPARGTDPLDALRRQVEGPAVGVGTVDDVQGAATALGLRRGPQGGVARLRRAVHADDDGAGVGGTDGAFHGSSQPRSRRVSPLTLAPPGAGKEGRQGPAGGPKVPIGPARSRPARRGGSSRSPDGTVRPSKRGSAPADGEWQHRTPATPTAGTAEQEAS
ncbi:hypothetical protein VR44_08760 [Streptomyces katrae]|uniref:Uncharacterized protein n=1 Tax=Streptomyces katrae TaxID=68223 RepID=A0A0F4JQE5_9ACTN|nr:hypothetical protein VR44_08760 [Streptomyces katrae]